MECLNNAHLVGDDPRAQDAVADLFGDVAVELLPRTQQPHDEHWLTVRRFRNVYTDPSGEKPLYVLVPDSAVLHVWPGSHAQYSTVKFGTATPMGERHNVPICSAVVLQRTDGIGLYICLDPRGTLIRDEDNLGI